MLDKKFVQYKFFRSQGQDKKSQVLLLLAIDQFYNLQKLQPSFLS